MELQTDEFLTTLIQRFKAQAHQSDAFPARDLLVRQRLRIRYLRATTRTPFRCQFERDDFSHLAPVIEGEVMRGTVQPPPGLVDLLKLCKIGRASCRER